MEVFRETSCWAQTAQSYLAALISSLPACTALVIKRKGSNQFSEVCFKLYFQNVSESCWNDTNKDSQITGLFHVGPF